MPRPRRASCTFVGQTPVCRTKVQLAVPAAGTRRRTTDRSFPASKILRGSLRRHTVFKVQYYDAAARAANPSDGLRRSGAVSRFGGHDGVLSCGRKRECIPDRTHVLVFTWTDVRTCSHMSGCTNTNILARPLAGKSESEHPHTHDCRHPFTNSCKRSCLHASAHRVIISFKHRFIVEHIPVRVSVCSQKGDVGKSSLTVLVASWLHYVMKRNVLVVDCDFPQWSIYTQRECELHVSKFTNRPQEYGWRDRNPPLLTTFQADFIKPYDYGICKGKIEVVGEPVRTRNHLLSTHASSAGETAPDID